MESSGLKVGETKKNEINGRKEEDKLAANPSGMGNVMGSDWPLLPWCV